MMTFWIDGALDDAECSQQIRQQTMKGRQRQMHESSDPQLDLFSLQKNLLQVWENLNVDEYYQNLILTHLDSLPGNQAQSVIAKEIKATHEGSSQYFKLAERLRIRKKELAALSSLVGQGGGEELAEITQLLGELRDHNLAVAEMLIGLHREYSGNGAGVSDQCMQMLLSLDADNDFLKESFLSQFILFQQGYDPFFLYHYDMRAKKGTPQTHPLIDQLFNLSISYACRLFKAKTKVLEMLSQGKYNQTKTFKRRCKSYGRKKKETTITPDEQSGSKRGTSTNFNVRKMLSLDKAKEREKLMTIDASSRESPTRKPTSPLISKEKMEQQFQERDSDYSGEEEQAFKLVPVRYKVKKSLPRSQFLQDLRKQSLPAQQDDQPQMKYSLNFKEKLQPLPRKLQPEEGSDRSSIFKRSTIKQPMLRPLVLPPKVPEESPLASKRSKMLPEQSIKSSNGSQGKEIKMRPGKATISELVKYLKELDLPQELKTETIVNARFEESLSKCQSYLSQFLVNGEVKAVGVSFALPDGDYLVKLWGPLRSCEEETSRLLLRKYLEYLQRQTGCACIYYGGNYSKSLFLSLDFQAKNDKLFFRRRTTPVPARNLEFPQFLSLKCSSIRFPQDNRNINMLYSDEIEAFSPTNHYLLPAFAAINRQGLASGVQLAAKVSQDIADMKALNSLLEDEQLDTYQVANAMKITQIAAIRLASAINFRSPFLAGEGSFRLSGEEVLRRGESLIVRVQGVQMGSQVLVGKGLSSMGAFVEAIKQAQGQQKRASCEFAVRMFNKQLYGRIPGGDGELCNYGNWEFSLSWKDDLQGRVKHNLSSFQSFGPEPFFFGLELQKQLLFCFQVTSEDFLY